MSSLNLYLFCMTLQILLAESDYHFLGKNNQTQLYLALL